MPSRKERMKEGRSVIEVKGWVSGGKKGDEEKEHSSSEKVES